LGRYLSDVAGTGVEQVAEDLGSSGDSPDPGLPSKKKLAGHISLPLAVTGMLKAGAGRRSRV
jgi:hypothetical protein